MHLKVFHAVYGIALVAVGTGLFFKTDEILQKTETFPILANSQWFSRICIYFIGIILLGGGVQKISRYFRSTNSEASDKPADS